MNRTTRKANRLIDSRTAVKVIVTLTDGGSFAGLIIDLDTNWLLIREAAQLGPQGSSVGVDGELLLPRDRIAYVQKP
jgi:hypothetical protein